MRTRAYTLVEMLLALTFFGVLCLLVWGLMRQFVGRSSRLSVTTGASRTMVQQQSRHAIAKLFYRLQESIEVLSPVPGQTASTVEFRDILNQTVRLRHDPDRRALVTERLEGGGYTLERTLPVKPMVQPIEIQYCPSVRFTTLTPTTVFVSFTTSDEGVTDSFVSLVHLKNSGLTVE